MMAVQRIPYHQDPQRILVILPTWVGDCVMATPTLCAIRNRFADARITFLTEPNLRELLRGGDWMDECIDWPAKHRRLPWHGEFRRLVTSLWERRFDWAVLLPNSFRPALTVWLVGARRRIGYSREWRGMLLTDRISVPNRAGTLALRLGKAPGNKNMPALRLGMPPDRLGMPPQRGWFKRRFVPMPIVDYYADLAEAIGCERPGDRLELFTTPDDDQSVTDRLVSVGLADAKPLVVISPGAKYGAAKCWLPERFAETADRLVVERGAAVIITCGPGEEDIARPIGSAMKQRGFVLDQPILTLGELKSLIARSDLLICNDAGPRHLAKAFGVPVVTVFGPTHPEWTATSYADERIVRIDVDCGPCQQRVCPWGHHKCMTGVSVDMVFDAATQLLRTRVPGAQCAHS